METLTSGTMAGAGSFQCSRCGYLLTLAGSDTLSDCPACGGREFVRASLFSASGLARGRVGAAMPAARNEAGEARGRILDRSGFSEFRIRRGEGIRGEGIHSEDRGAADGERTSEADTIRHGAIGGVLAHEPDDDSWLQHAREQLREPGEYLVYEDAGKLKTVALTREWTRIGRSLAADVRFDDPTVSRRHALVVRQADGVRVLDDRSLNGVFINGERIDRSGVGQQVLQDGDEILVGRYRLRFLSVRRAPATAATVSSLPEAG